MQVILITGCSSGFGEAIACAFANRGDRVLATMRDPRRAPESLRRLAADRPNDVVIAALDVADADMRRNAIDRALAHFGRIDVLINNAGVGARGAFEDTPQEQWRAMFETNLFGPLELIRLALPIMRGQGAGRIVNVTSVAAVLKTPLMAAYCASKHALDTATAALDIETRSFGVRAICVMPGPFRTALPRNSLDRPASPPYAAIVRHFDGIFNAMEAAAPDDLAPVVDAVIAAATDADPPLRLTAGVDQIAVLPPILQALAPLQRIGLHLTGQD